MARKISCCLILLLALIAAPAQAQLSGPLWQNSGSNLGRASIVNMSTGFSCSISGGTVTCTGFSGGAVASPILGPDGSAGAPTYAFSNHTDTGMFWNSGVAFSVGGSQKALVTNSTFYTPGALNSLTGYQTVVDPTELGSGLALAFTSQSGTTYSPGLDGNNFPNRVIVWLTNTLARAITMPTAASYTSGGVLLLVDAAGTGGAANITAVRSSTDTVNGGTGAAAVVTANYAHSTCISDGTSAWVCGVNN